MIHEQEHTLPTEVALGQLLIEWGYLVYATNVSHEVGDIVYGFAYGERVNQPCYVIGKSSYAEFEAWCKRFSELTGKRDPSNFLYAFYYRVATD